MPIPAPLPNARAKVSDGASDGGIGLWLAEPQAFPPPLRMCTQLIFFPCPSLASTLEFKQLELQGWRPSSWRSLCHRYPHKLIAGTCTENGRRVQSSWRLECRAFAGRVGCLI